LKVSKSVIYQYFLSFFIVSVIPLIIMSYLLYDSQIIKQKEAISSQYVSSITQVKTKMDYIIKNLSNLSLSLGAQYELEALMPQAQGPLGTATSVIQYQGSLLYPSPEIFLYHRGSREVFTSQGRMSYPEFENFLGGSYNMTMIKLFSRLNTCQKQDIFSSSYYTQGDGASGLCLMYPLPYPDPQAEGAITYLYTAEQLGELFTDFIGDVDGSILIFDEYLKQVYCGGMRGGSSTAPPAALLGGLKKLKGTGLYTLNANGLEYVAVRTLSENTGISYCLLMESADAFAPLARQKLRFYITTALLALAGLLSSALLALYNYRPLRRLKLRQKYGNGTQKNEFELLGNILESHDRMHEQLAKARPLVQNRCLEHILMGAKREDELEYYVQCAAMRFLYSRFCVMIVYLPAQDARIPSMAGRLEKGALENLLCYALDLNLEPGKAAALLNGELEEAQLPGLAARLRHAADVREEGSCVVGVGAICDSLEGCSASFLEAKAALELRGEEESVALYRPEPAGTMRGEYPVIEYTLLLQSIKHGNRTVAMNVCEEILSAIRERCPSVLILRYITGELVGNLMRLAKKLEIPVDIGQFTAVPSDFGFFEKFAGEMRALVSQLCGGVNRSKSESYESLKREVMDYISRSFCSYDLSLEAVSNRFGISAAYLRQIIFEETESHFIPYITLLRMEKAKELLTQTDMKVKDIVEAVGYKDSANFIRKFKNSEGMTPGQYRAFKAQGG
jgi:two-component system response regulator YesN